MYVQYPEMLIQHHISLTIRPDFYVLACRRSGAPEIFLDTEQATDSISYLKHNTAKNYTVLYLIAVFKLKSDRKNNKQALQPKWSTAVQFKSKLQLSGRILL
jgi:hypothetical protein